MPATLKNPIIKDLFSDELVLPSLLLAIFVDYHGTDALEYDPAVIRKILEEEFAYTETNFNKLLAAIDLTTNNRFWKDLPSFINLCNALADGKFDPRIVDLATVQDISIAVMDSVLIWPEDLEAEFSPQILRYIDSMLKLEKFVIPPKVLMQLLPKIADIDQDSLLDVQNDPFLFEAAFKTAKIKADAVDDDVLKRLSTSKSYAEAGEYKDIARLYEEMIVAINS